MQGKRNALSAYQSTTLKLIYKEDEDEDDGDDEESPKLIWSKFNTKIYIIKSKILGDYLSWKNSCCCASTL